MGQFLESRMNFMHNYKEKWQSKECLGLFLFYGPKQKQTTERIRFDEQFVLSIYIYDVKVN